MSVEEADVEQRCVRVLEESAPRGQGRRWTQGTPVEATASGHLGMSWVTGTTSTSARTATRINRSTIVKCGQLR